MTVAAGLDVGGTKIRCAAVELESGTVVAQERRPTDPARGGAAVLAECVALVERVATRVPVVGIGVGICELVDPKGRAASAFTIDWLGFDVARAFRHVAPARLESDVRAAALAEAPGSGSRSPRLRTPSIPR
jgi:glucokinase